MKIHIPTPLRQYADKKPALTVDGSTVAEGLQNLTAQHPELKKHLFTDQGKLRAFVNVYVNDEDIRYLKNVETVVRDGDEVAIVPSIAGGSCPK